MEIIFNFPLRWISKPGENSIYLNQRLCCNFGTGFIESSSNFRCERRIKVIDIAFVLNRMGDIFKCIRRTYATRDTNAITNTCDAMLFMVQPVHQFHTINLINGQGGTHLLHINEAGIVQHASPSQNRRGRTQPLQSNGRRMLQHVSPNPRARRFALNFDQVAQKFNVPIGKAAKEFQLATSTLKLHCRELGFKKRPYPKLKSLRNLVNDLTKYRVRDFQNIAEEILEEIEFIKDNPSLDIKDETKILRQQMYELKRKKRRRNDTSAS
ncbi:RWP-RK domain-containing family protein [Rhynchospora pubera]|uniref:RWP-RK domain-containing family protein n=1 Tax=Rhynchospora pubera TaxID=906938 RepID=A0AAV8EM08_9POAL|nr:RWP-RK domain-containing family protein [Rhynchospora pubera]